MFSFHAFSRFLLLALLLFLVSYFSPPFPSSFLLKERGQGPCARLLAALQRYSSAGSQALSSEVTSTLRGLAVDALTQVPSLRGALEAVGWDAEHRQFMGPLGQTALASLQAAVASVLAAQAAEDEQVFCGRSAGKQFKEEKRMPEREKATRERERERERENCTWGLIFIFLNPTTVPKPKQIHTHNHKHKQARNQDEEPCDLLLAVLRSLHDSGTRALSGEAASTLCTNACCALAQAPELLPAFVAAGWDPAFSQFAEGLSMHDLTMLEAAVAARKSQVLFCPRLLAARFRFLANTLCFSWC